MIFEIKADNCSSHSLSLWPSWWPLPLMSSQVKFIFSSVGTILNPTSKLCSADTLVYCLRLALSWGSCWLPLGLGGTLFLLYKVKSLKIEWPTWCLCCPSCKLVLTKLVGFLTCRQGTSRVNSAAAATDRCMPNRISDHTSLRLALWHSLNRSNIQNSYRWPLRALVSLLAWAPIWALAFLVLELA